MFGLAEDALDADGRTLHVVRQIKLVESHPVFDLPKGEKIRDVPLPASMASALQAHSEYMGHADPALTPRVYAHLMPDSHERARRAIDLVFHSIPDGHHGRQTA